MTKIFKIEPSHRKIISKPTLLKALTYLDKKAFETPFLLIDTERVKEKVDIIGKNIRNSKVFYAVKANPDIEVIKFLHSLGMGFEIASEGELKLLEAIRVPADRIITSNPVKSFKFLSLAAKYGLRYFAFDSKDEVDKMKKYVPGSNVYVRLTVPNEGSEWPLSRKFGVEPDDALSLVLYAKKKGLNPVGITFHVGSQCTNMHNWSTALLKAKALWDMAGEKGIMFGMLNIGGGYPIKYTKDVVNIEPIEKVSDRLIYEKFPAGTEVFIEPGRAVVGDAGIFVCKVIGKARRGDENWLYIDVGVFNGLMESVGGIKYSYIVESSDRKRHKKQWTVTGPSCDSFDVIDKDVALPEPKVGGLILILSSGAYTISYASEFNGFSIPKTILI
ncbi:MAG: type III PLP-dependent enzyme [Thermodesulfovibrionales bacterium]|nr:type III PLP-dependent enzyme [Thermodesulfovibrionales bacterium]